MPFRPECRPFLVLPTVLPTPVALRMSTISSVTHSVCYPQCYPQCYPRCPLLARRSSSYRGHGVQSCAECRVCVACACETQRARGVRERVCVCMRGSYMQSSISTTGKTRPRSPSKTPSFEQSTGIWVSSRSAWGRISSALPVLCGCSRV